MTKCDRATRHSSALPRIFRRWLWLSALVAGCGQSGAAKSPAPPPSVTVSHPLQQTITDYEVYTGRTAAVESVDVMARVTGYLDRIVFQEGTEVSQGNLLYEIDPRPYQATFDQAKAQVAQNTAGLSLAKVTYQRYLKLFQSKPPAVTAEDVDTYRSQELQAEANLQAAQATLETARLNLDWTKVQSPINGIMSRTLVTRGNLVIANQTLLTTIVSSDPMYAYFDVDEATVEHIRQLIREGQLQPTQLKSPAAAVSPSKSTSPAPGKQPQESGPMAAAEALLRAGTAGQLRDVYLGLANEKGYPHKAYVDFWNNSLNLSTATLQVRAVFSNPKPSVGPRVFAPGMFIRVRVPTSPPYKAILVGQEAIGTDQNLKYVYVLNAQNAVVRNEVTLGALHDRLQVIAKGLKGSERVLMSGLQHVHPGQVVQPKLVPMPVPQSAEPALQLPLATKPTAAPQKH